MTPFDFIFAVLLIGILMAAHVWRDAAIALVLRPKSPGRDTTALEGTLVDDGIEIIYADDRVADVIEGEVIPKGSVLPPRAWREFREQDQPFKSAWDYPTAPRETQRALYRIMIDKET